MYFYTVNAQTKIFIDRVGHLHNARERSLNKVGGAKYDACIIANSTVPTAARMIMAFPLVMALAPEKGDAIKDTRGFKLAGELGKSMVQIAKATASLKRLNSGSQELWMTRGNLQTTFIER